MPHTFEALYEDGVLRPLDDLPLRNNERVTVSIAGADLNGQDLAYYFSPEEWQAATSDTITLEEVRRALSSIPGCLSDAVIASREDR